MEVKIQISHRRDRRVRFAKRKQWDGDGWRSSYVRAELIALALAIGQRLLLRQTVR